MSASLSPLATDPQWRILPESPRALGELRAPDGTRLLTIAFDTHRDIIASIGYAPGERCGEALCACAAALCSLARGKAVMAAELSPGKIPQRWTAQLLMLPAMWRKMWWQPALPGAVKCSWRMQLAWHTRYR